MRRPWNALETEHLFVVILGFFKVSNRYPYVIDPVTMPEERIGPFLRMNNNRISQNDDEENSAE